MQEITASEMYGIAKKFNNEMEALPLHTHSAIVEMVRVGMQHRNLSMQAMDKARADALQERAMRAQEAQIELAREHHQRQDAASLHGMPELVKQ